MAKLWAADGGDVHRLVEDYCFAGDVVLDAALVRYDILGSLAHAEMLRKIGVLSAAELSALQTGLRRVLGSYERGRWRIEARDEDVHTAVETRLSKVGLKLHTARSRNDQVLTDMRLYSKDHLIRVAADLAGLAEVWVKLARRHEFIPMPGYTHLQRAMPSSVGMWLGAYGEALIDAFGELERAYGLLDQCPLGSGAGYGVALPIDRELTARLLGFSRVQMNSVYCQNSRGLFEASLISALAFPMAVASRMSADVCLYCSQEFGFLKLPNEFTTGSSIMPQKRNPDVFELIRAKSSRMLALETATRTATFGLSSGYSKDLQEIKGPVMEAFELTQKTLKVLALVSAGLEPQPTAMAAAMSPELFATEKAYELVSQGVPFRQAYLEVKANLGDLKAVDPVRSIRSSRHLGATGNLQLGGLLERIRARRADWKKREQVLYRHWNRLLQAK